MCGRCLRYAPQRLSKKCAVCNGQVWFCDEDCEQADIVAPHDAICPALVHLTSARFDKQIVSMLRLMLEILYRQVNHRDEYERNMAPLAHHAEQCQLEEADELKKPFELLRTALSTCDWAGESVFDVARMA